METISFYKRFHPKIRDWFSIKYLYHTRLLILQKLPGDVYLFMTALNGNLLIVCKKSSVLGSIKLAQYVYHLIYTVKGILFAKQLKRIESFESGNNILKSFIFWFALACNGFVTYPFLQCQTSEFTGTVNSLYRNIPGIGKSFLAKFLLLAGTVYIPFLTFIFSIFVFTISHDPILHEFVILLKNPHSIIASILRIILACYEIWNIAVLAAYGTLIVLGGLFLSYTALCSFPKTLFIKSKEISKSHNEELFITMFITIDNMNFWLV